MVITAHFYKMGRAAADDRSRGKSYRNANAASPCAGSCIPEAKGPFKPETANLNAFLLDGRRPFSFSGKKMGVASRGTCAAKPFAPVRKSIRALTGAKVRNIFMIFKKSGPPEWLLVCLGNYGKQYENTRHNIGFMAAERLIDKRDLRCNRLRFRALTEVIEFGGANVLLMMPQTYMNLSGEAVGEAARFYKIPADHVIVISDDISLPLGKLRVRGSGSAGGHNGLKNIIAHLGTDAFPRVKVGVGAPEHDIVDWVIGPFTASERKVIDGVLDRALGAAECIITDGVSAAQNRYNG